MDRTPSLRTYRPGDGATTAWRANNSSPISDVRSRENWLRIARRGLRVTKLRSQAAIRGSALIISRFIADGLPRPPRLLKRWKSQLSILMQQRPSVEPTHRAHSVGPGPASKSHCCQLGCGEGTEQRSFQWDHRWLKPFHHSHLLRLTRAMTRRCGSRRFL